MKEKVISDVTGKSYYIADVVRIVNIKQCAVYLRNGAELLDVYPSIDAKTSNPILVFIFDRKKTRDLYSKWCNYELS